MNRMLAVAIAFSTLGLFVGPALVIWGKKRQGLATAVDGLTRVVVPTVVVIDMVPHLFEEIGSVGPVLVVVGFMAPWLLERRGSHSGRVGPTVVLPTLVMHSVFDGTALALVFGEQGSDAASLMLVAALVIHRLPEGLFVGATLVPCVGSRGTFKWVGVLAASTLVGALGGRGLLRLLPR